MMGEETQPFDEACLVYPTLDLFIYDRGETLGDDELDLDKARRHFWNKIYSNLSEEQLQTLESYEGKNIANELLPKRYEPLANLDGYLYPVRLGDVYALQVESSGQYLESKKPDYRPKRVRSIRELKSQVIQNIDRDEALSDRLIKERRGTLGETWLFWCQVTQPEKLENIAREIYKTLELPEKPDFDRDLQSRGQFLGGSMFEFWKTPTLWNLELSEFHQAFPHVVLLLFPPDLEVEKIADRMSRRCLDFLRWFEYRNKIVWATWQSHQLKHQLKKHYGRIKNRYEQIHERIQNKQFSLNLLKRELTDLSLHQSEYARKLILMDAQRQTISINLANHEQRQESLGIGWDAQINNAWNPKVFRQQIELDRDNLSSGLTLLDNLIRNIEGVIQIEQTKSDRKLNVTIGIASVGLATSALAVTVATTQPPDAQQTRELTISNILLDPAFLLSLFIGIGGSLVMWLLLQLWKRNS
ncbi:hypothetical protein POG22_17120 [Geitlerinema sp. CS-897]|nr:hypothetical protein [Geitlerinema sp. CS-897]